MGKAAEELAAQHLQNQGFVIIARNYRYKRAEIDIIAQKGGLLLFVEVKARSSNYFGYPEEFVSPQQQDLLREAAEHYILEQDWNYPIRFDVIAVLKKYKQEVEVSHFEDAFY